MIAGNILDQFRQPKRQPEALVALERARAAIKTPFRGDSVRRNEAPATTLPESEAA
jgi:hypothetical protein